MSLSLSDRILAAIPKATSAAPAKAAVVLAALGAGDAEGAAALDQLARLRLISTAHIYRPATDPAPWLAIWPTGVKAAPCGWQEMRDKAPRHVPTAQVPAAPASPRKSKPLSLPEAPPMTTPVTATPSTTDLRRAAIVQLVSGLPPEKGLSIKELATHIGVELSAVYSLISPLAIKGLVARTSRPGERGVRVFDPQHASKAENLAAQGVEPLAPIPATAPPQAPAAEPPAPGAAPLRMALWDDGALDIYDGDTLIQLNAADTTRLARLLGVPNP